MPRSARRRSQPSSPAKSRVVAPAATPHQARNTRQTRSREVSTQNIAKHNQGQESLARVDEEEGPGFVRDSGSAQKNAKSSANVAQIAKRAEAAASSSRVESIRASVYNNVELTDLRLDLMAKHLTELDFRADEILSQLTLYPTDQLLAHFGDRQSATWTDFSEQAYNLENARQHYSADQDLLEIDLLRESLQAAKVPSIGAEYVFMKANLALFAYRLIEAHPVELHNLLVALTEIQTFPEPFAIRKTSDTRSSIKYNKEFQSLTIALGLDVLTQCFIFKRARSPTGDESDDDYDHLMNVVFFEDIKTARARDVTLGLPTPEQEDMFIRLVEQRMAVIEDAITTEEDGGTNVDALKEQFPWTAFVTRALEWVALRAAQIDSLLTDEGGVRSIKHSLQQPRKSDRKGKSLTKGNRTSKVAEQFAGNISFLKGLDDLLNAGELEFGNGQDGNAAEVQAAGEEEQVEAEGVAARQQQDRSRSATAPSQSKRILQEISLKRRQPQIEEEEEPLDLPVDNSDPNVEDQVNLMNDDQYDDPEIPESGQSITNESAIRPTQETSAVLNVISRQAKISNKENTPARIRSTAPEASRTNDTQQASNAPERSLLIKKGKRARIATEDDEDEDAFETDTRQPATKRARSAPTEEDVPNNGHAQNPIDNDDQGMLLPETIEQSESSQQRSPMPPPRQPTAQQQKPRPAISSTQPVNSPTRPFSHDRHHSYTPTSSQPPPSSFEAYTAIKTQARANTALATAVAPPIASFRAPQIRRAWTAREIERLLYLIKEYGCAWSMIKKADERMVDPQLLDRSQVQLKDKARNMKVDYLKAEVGLPEGFEGVTISASMKEKLREMNIAVPGDEEGFEE